MSENLEQLLNDVIGERNALRQQNDHLWSIIKQQQAKIILLEQKPKRSPSAKKQDLQLPHIAPPIRGSSTNIKNQIIKNNLSTSSPVSMNEYTQDKLPKLDAIDNDSCDSQFHKRSNSNHSNTEKSNSKQNNNHSLFSSTSSNQNNILFDESLHLKRLISSASSQKVIPHIFNQDSSILNQYNNNNNNSPDFAYDHSPSHKRPISAVKHQLLSSNSVIQNNDHLFNVRDIFINQTDDDKDLNSAQQPTFIDAINECIIDGENLASQDILLAKLNNFEDFGITFFDQKFNPLIMTNSSNNEEAIIEDKDLKFIFVLESLETGVEVWKCEKSFSQFWSLDDQLRFNIDENSNSNLKTIPLPDLQTFTKKTSKRKQQIDAYLESIISTFPTNTDLLEFFKTDIIGVKRAKKIETNNNAQQSGQKCSFAADELLDEKEVDEESVKKTENIRLEDEEYENIQRQGLEFGDEIGIDQLQFVGDQYVDLKQNSILVENNSSLEFVGQPLDSLGDDQQINQQVSSDFVDGSETDEKRGSDSKYIRQHSELDNIDDQKAAVIDDQNNDERDKFSVDNIEKQGYLMKKGKGFGGYTWKNRFFILKNGFLECYENEENTHQSQSTGIIKLKYCEIAIRPPEDEQADPSLNHSFCITEFKKTSFHKDHSFIPSEKKVNCRYVLHTKTNDEAIDWVDAIDECIKRLRPSRPLISRPVMVERIIPPTLKIVLNDVTTMPRESLITTPISSTLAVVIPLDSPDAGVADLVSPIAPPLTVRNGQGLTGRKPPLSADRLHAGGGDGGGGGGVDESQRIMKQMVVPLTAVFDQHSTVASLKKKKEVGGVVVEKHGKKKMASFFGKKEKKGDEGKFESGPKSAVFGVSLEVALQASRINENFELPAVVYRCIEYLDAKKAVDEEGIFRLSGSNSEIQKLKERFNNDGDYDLLGSGEYFDVHAIAGLLKLFFRELTSPILTNEKQKSFLHLTELKDREEKIEKLKYLSSKLPKSNYTLLKVLISHLISVVQNSAKNKMTIRNVGIVFAPTLSVPAGVFTLMMSEYDSIFVWDGLQESEPSRFEYCKKDIIPLPSATDSSTPQTIIPQPLDKSGQRLSKSLPLESSINELQSISGSPDSEDLEDIDGLGASMPIPRKRTMKREDRKKAAKSMSFDHESPFSAMNEGGLESPTWNIDDDEDRFKVPHEPPESLNRKNSATRKVLGGRITIPLRVDSNEGQQD